MSELPPISCMCTTYGRTKCLAEAVEYFLRQDYPGELQLLVLNDCVVQDIRLDNSEIRAGDRRQINIFNHSSRFRCLGDKRTELVARVKHRWIMTWGDDDIHLPWECRTNMESVMEQGLDMGLIGHMFASMGHEITYKISTPCGPFLMRKEMFYDLGGFPAKNVGEDTAFQIKAKASKWKVGKMKREPGFIYRWGNGDYHISGLGIDRPDKRSSWDVIADMVRAKMDKGQEPRGLVNLKPAATYDWEQAVMKLFPEGLPLLP